MNSCEVQAPHAFRPDVQSWGANARFGAQERKRPRKCFIEGFGNKRAILIPPQSSTVNLRLRSLGDHAEQRGQSAPALAW
jgi:hypothetical protein